MRLKGALNRGLTRATGYELRRAAVKPKRRKRKAGEPGDRLLTAPAFVMCSVRSGSTLLRVLLDSHSQIHSPQELHLRDLSVKVRTDYAAKALSEIGLDDRQMRFLLWDRLLQRELASAGKSVLVNKTPNDVFIADLIAECWPDAKFIYLLRHPGSIARSRQETRPQDTPERNARMVLRYGNAIEEARIARPDGLTIRYEDLTADPKGSTQRALRVPRRPVGGGDARVRPLRPRQAQARAGRLEDEDQDRLDPARRPAAPARRDPPVAARALRRLGLRAGAGGAAGLVKVSVVVPVFNPGHDIDDCLRTLLGQSLPDDEYELIFVDDGSTDATPARLDALAAEHANVHVEHIPNSGWPGRPRNLGTDRARGDYVLYVDNDDYLGEEALERMHAMAVRDDADIVIGKVVGHGKSVPRNLFRRNRTGVDLEWEALIWLLTPHKLFRRAFLDDHDLRFPEGRRRLEDHVFLMRAYFEQPRISVLADYPCYHWVAARPRRQRVVGPARPADVLRVHGRGARRDRRATPSPGRSATGSTRAGTAGRCSTGSRRSTATRTSRCAARLYETMHEVAVARIPESVDAFVPFNLQARSRLLRAGDLDALAALADTETALRAQVRVAGVTPGKTAELTIRAELEGCASRATASGSPGRARTRRRRSPRAARCSCCSSAARRRRSTGRRPRSRPSWSTVATASARC